MFSVSFIIAQIMGVVTIELVSCDLNLSGDFTSVSESTKSVVLLTPLQCWLCIITTLPDVIIDNIHASTKEDTVLLTSVGSKDAMMVIQERNILKVLYSTRKVHRFDNS